MFIERSTAKIRGVRLLFVLFGLLPCAGLLVWAAVRHSSSHRDAIRRVAEQAVGLSVGIEDIRHVRPGAMRLHGCSLKAPGGQGVLVVPEVEVEASSDEVRFRIPSLSCGPAAVAALADVARAWLDEPVRFSRAWVIDIGSFAWDVDGYDAVGRDGSVTNPAVSRFPLRIECVAAGNARAVRVHRTDGGGTEDEVRVIAAPGSSNEYEVRASLREAVPWGVIQPLLPSALVAGVALGPASSVTGTLEASMAAEGWSGVASGMIDGIDLASLTAAGRHRLEGTLTLTIARLAWSAGRIVMLDTTGSATRGRMAQSLLGSLVTTCGCRPGPAFHSLAGEAMRTFDDMQVTVVVDGRGLRVSAGSDRGGALARRQGLSLIDAPSGTVPLDRLAWLIDPSDVPAVPASAGASWLMRVLPSPGPTGRRDGSTAIRPPGEARQEGDLTAF